MSVPFLTALNGTLKSPPALAGEMPEDLRLASKLYQLPQATTAPATFVGVSASNETVQYAIADAESATSGVTSYLALNDAGDIIRGNKMFLNVLDYGAVADAGGSNTDNTTVFQTVLDLAQENGFSVFIPAGRYYFAEDSASLDPGAGGFSIIGEYGVSELWFHEGDDSTAKSLFYNTDNISKGHLLFHGIKIVGTFDDRGTAQGGPAVFLDHYQDLKFSYCKWKNCAGMATDLHFNTEVSADHCSFEDIGRDGFRTRECFYVSATNNYFRRLGDDAISSHGGKYVAGYDPDDGSPRREGLVVTGNQFFDTSACITNLGARQSVIANNVANRFRAYFYYCSSDSSEGTHPASNIKVVNNVGLNVITGIGAYVIMSAVTPRGATVTSSVVPGQPHSSGSFEHAWDWQNADSLDTADPFPPIENIDISGNIFARTLPAVANYSDWGYGTQGSGTYGFDPAVTDADLRPPSALNIPIGRITTIRDNHLSHTIEGIFFNAQSGVSPVMVGGIISRNTITDFTARGIALTGVTSKLINLSVDDNVIDGDIYRLSGNSNVDGSYDSGTIAPMAFDFGTSIGARVSRNRFSNVAIITPHPENILGDNNIVVADIAGLGDIAGNKGVRNLPAAEYGFQYVIAYCDPTDSANYGAVKNIMLSAASAQPSAGYYVRGHFVANNVKSRLDRNTLLGWLRLTTGSSHTADVDWLEIYGEGRQRFQNFKSWSPGTITSGSRATTTLTVTGAKKGAFPMVSFETDLAGCTLHPSFDADDVATVIIKNDTGGSITPAGAVLRVTAYNF